ncbi:MAG: hypothetical protein ABI868_14155 [Acidobacteriota bacterium]
MPRALRLLLAAICGITLGATAIFAISSEEQFVERRAINRTFDLRSREVADALAELRSAQQAYVAAGQGVAFWLPKVEQAMDAIAGSLATLQQLATDAASKRALAEAAATLDQIRTLDKRIRGYIASGAQLMASDIVSTEGSETVVTAARQVERARLQERQALEAFEASRRSKEAMAIAGTGALLLLVVVVLALRPAGAAVGRAVRPAIESIASGPARRPISQSEPKPPEATPPPEDPAHVAAASTIIAAAQLCTELGRVGDAAGLQTLIGRAAALLDASGLMLWMASASGEELLPALAHGYDSQTLARIPAVPRSASNAAAAAFRSATLQVVPWRAGSANGAIIAPVLSADGCIGVLSAEMRGGAEASETLQAVAAIIAAQLASVVAVPSAPAQDRPADSAAM